MCVFFLSFFFLSQLNIYMKEIDSPPPQRTCLKRGLLGEVMSPRRGSSSCGVGWGLAVEWLPSVPRPQPAPGQHPLPTPSPTEGPLLTGHDTCSVPVVRAPVLAAKSVSWVIYLRDQSCAPHWGLFGRRGAWGSGRRGRAGWLCPGAVPADSRGQWQGLLLGGFWVLMWRSGNWWSSVPCSVNLSTLYASSPQPCPAPAQSSHSENPWVSWHPCTKAGAGGGVCVCVCLLTNAIWTALCVWLQEQTPDSTYSGGILQLPAFYKPQGWGPSCLPFCRSGFLKWWCTWPPSNAPPPPVSLVGGSCSPTKHVALMPRAPWGSLLAPVGSRSPCGSVPMILSHSPSHPHLRSIWSQLFIKTSLLSPVMSRVPNTCPLVVGHWPPLEPTSPQARSGWPCSFVGRAGLSLMLS